MKRLLLAIPLLLVFMGSVSATTYTCDSCASCEGYIENSTEGDVVQLTNDLTGLTTTCMDIDNVHDVDFDCGWHTISSVNQNSTLMDFNSWTGSEMYNCLFNQTGSMSGSIIRTVNPSEYVFYNIEIDAVGSNTNIFYLEGSPTTQSYFNNTILRNITMEVDSCQIAIGLLAPYNVTVDGAYLTHTAGDDYGIYVTNYDLGSDYEAIVINSEIHNFGVGLYGEFSSGDTMLVYNNLFNNSDNYGNNTGMTTYFNTTLIEDTNIIGGSYIGGNYWGHPNGSGFSDNCTDSDTDGICDSVYADSGGTDFLPLTFADSIAPTTPPIDSIPAPFNGVAAVAVAAGFILLMVGLYFESGIDTRFFITGTIGLVIVIAVIGFLLTGS